MQTYSGDLLYIITCRGWAIIVDVIIWDTGARSESNKRSRLLKLQFIEGELGEPLNDIAQACCLTIDFNVIATSRRRLVCRS